jgi:hypothetical protein
MLSVLRKCYTPVRLFDEGVSRPQGIEFHGSGRRYRAGGRLGPRWTVTVAAAYDHGNWSIAPSARGEPNDGVAE